MVLSDFLFWEIAEKGPANIKLPSSICTQGVPDIASRMPPEVALLLPGAHNERDFADNDQLPDSTGIGVFVANPILNITKLVHNFRKRKILWVVNLPSVAQHEIEFRKNLDDVGIDFQREMSVLQILKSEGFKVIAVCGSADDGEAAQKIGAEALLSIPSVDRFEAGFPSTQTRADQVAQLRATSTENSFPILGLLTEVEKRQQTTWPAGYDAGVVRPRIFK